jgi:hypothetical protein
VPESTNDHPDPKFADPETALGGADAVEKTTYVVGSGTSPEARTPHGRPPSVGHPGSRPIGWIAIALAILVAIVYFVGVAVRS